MLFFHIGRNVSNIADKVKSFRLIILLFASFHRAAASSCPKYVAFDGYSSIPSIRLTIVLVKDQTLVVG